MWGEVELLLEHRAPLALAFELRAQRPLAWAPPPSALLPQLPALPKLPTLLPKLPTLPRIEARRRSAAETSIRVLRRGAW